ncbi:hypothetical protein llap_7189 [Limosa lapponica baueri]|uniref:Uncharacterized protein n=1 Tax=Limosa lapponica baueri TaxID=1758121 RepID=A0A2I0U8W1_LIMLA|nr:hypothetical protein llap_7189 [Limosa lapponica baueri]
MSAERVWRYTPLETEKLGLCYFCLTLINEPICLGERQVFCLKAMYKSLYSCSCFTFDSSCSVGLKNDCFP